MIETETFKAQRPRLFSIAYRMLGSAAEAEDVLQDAWLRLNGADDVRSTEALATTIVTRLCLDRMKSARATREEYIGPWLPEPVLTSELRGPDAMFERAESVTMAFLVLLETLTPEERAVFLLKEVFEYDHGDVAGLLGTSVANSRQLLHRAKARIKEYRPRENSSVESRRAVAEQFSRAFATGDGSALTTLLTNDVGLWSDGGGKASAARLPLHGCDAVLNFLLGIHRAAHTSGDLERATLRIEDVNYEPALVVRVADRLESVFVLAVEDGKITAIRVVRNPVKLARIDRQLMGKRVTPEA
jgi:RNA polymerase sigma-70 factor (ECF subfamily)